VTVALAAALGAGAGWALWVLLRPVLSQPLFGRENHRGATIPTAAGIVLVLAAVAVEATFAVLEAASVDLDGTGAARRLTLVAVLGYGFLGLLDDLGGSPAARGFRGHLAALGRGELTTGGVKLLGGGAVALLAVAPVAGENVGRLLRDGALVALAANLGNLLDRAPGRCTKVGILAAGLLLALTGADPALAGVAVVAGAAAATVVPDLREHLMLGDTGANVLGGAVGFGVVLSCSGGVRTGVLVGLVALNLASEAVSFSRVIERVAPLRALDGLGRRPRG
jgi:hypothetical protein